MPPAAWPAPPCAFTAAPSRGDARFDKAMDSLALDTDTGYKISLGLSLGMLALTLLALVYTVVIWAVGTPVTGWTTTMLVLSAGLAGMFFHSHHRGEIPEPLVRLTF